MRCIIDRKKMMELREKAGLKYAECDPYTHVRFSAIAGNLVRSITYEDAKTFAQLFNCSMDDFVVEQFEGIRAVGEYPSKLRVSKNHNKKKADKKIMKSSKQYKGINLNRNPKYAYFNGINIIVEDNCHDRLRELNAKMTTLAKEFKYLMSERQLYIDDIGTAMYLQGINKLVGPGWQINLVKENGVTIAKMEKI